MRSTPLSYELLYKAEGFLADPTWMIVPICV
jgi:hypothetical protein